MNNRSLSQAAQHWFASRISSRLCITVQKACASNRIMPPHQCRAGAMLDLESLDLEERKPGADDHGDDDHGESCFFFIRKPKEDCSG